MIRFWPWIIPAILLHFNIRSFASVNVAFIELKNKAGETVHLEPEFRYAHVAVKYEGMWLHSHPYRGVELIRESEIATFGKIGVVVAAPNPGLNSALVEEMIGLPYDDEFSWTDEKMYCSELVAKLLGISPRPMHFDLKLWPESFKKLEGKPGISPKGVYQAIVGNTWQQEDPSLQQY